MTIFFLDLYLLKCVNNYKDNLLVFICGLLCYPRNVRIVTACPHHTNCKKWFDTVRTCHCCNPSYYFNTFWLKVVIKSYNKVRKVGNIKDIVEKRRSYSLNFLSQEWLTRLKIHRSQAGTWNLISNIWFQVSDLEI